MSFIELHTPHDEKSIIVSLHHITWVESSEPGYRGTYIRLDNRSETKLHVTETYEQVRSRLGTG